MNVKHKMQTFAAAAFIVAMLICTNGFCETKSKFTTYSIQWQAFAPNAGGQRAYSFKRGKDDHEWGLFLNEYLLANGKPTLGAHYDWRYALCGSTCPIQVYGQAGLGLSTGGPFVDIGWSSIWLWVARIDVTTQIFITRNRLVTWSYPLWFGISIPLP